VAVFIRGAATSFPYLAVLAAGEGVALYTAISIVLEAGLAAERF
jgi:hypothetical protein